MVHYIRFLRTPRVALTGKHVIEVSCVVTITTDLGDSFLNSDVEIAARVLDYRDPDQIIWETFSLWKCGARVIKLSLRCPKSAQGRRVVLLVTSRVPCGDSATEVVPKVLEVWSSDFLIQNGSHSEPLVERRLTVNTFVCVKIWEETGDSIARHIWDAALGCLIFFQHIYSEPAKQNSQLPILSRLLNERSKGPLNILELGTGCGVVGIALAQVLSKCNVLLTDLEDAQAILRKNIEHAQPAPASTLKQQVLDWDLPRDESEPSNKTDLVVISDCIYNTNSIPPLVQTLKQLVKQSPWVKIWIARKRRHESESLFFELVGRAGVQLLESAKINLPHLATEENPLPTEIEFFLYGKC